MHAPSKESRPAVEPLEPRWLLAAARVVGYIPEYRYALFNQVDLSAVTHLNYFSITANANGSLSTAPGNLSHMQTIVASAHAQGKTVSIVIDPGSAFMSIAKNASALAAFANNITAFCTDNALDGIDLDWEPQGPPQADVTAYGTMITTLRQKSPTLILTTAVNPITKVVPVSAIPSLTWINVMGYDFDYANHAPYQGSIDALNSWNAYGAPKDKLVLGVPFYGRAGTSWSNTIPETYVDLVNRYAALYGAPPAPGVSDALLNFPNDFGGATMRWYFNGPTTIRAKAGYVADNGFGGVMIWELGQDHFDAQQHYTTSSLLPVIRNVLRPAWLAASGGANYTLTTTSLTIASGTVTFSADALSTHPALNVTVNPGATVVFNTPQHLGTLTLSGGRANLATTGPVTVTALNITNAGTLDLNAGQLVINYGTNPSPAANVRQWTGTAFNAGRWTGPGITSAAAVSDPNTLTAIGAFDDTTAHRLTVARTLYGDANLDGAINADDAAAIVLGRARNETSWSAGNFNYDTTLDADDYILFLRGAAYTAPPAAAPASFSTARATDLVTSTELPDQIP